MIALQKLQQRLFVFIRDFLACAGVRKSCFFHLAQQALGRSTYDLCELLYCYLCHYLLSFSLSSSETAY